MNASDMNPLAELALMDPGMAEAISVSLKKNTTSFTDEMLAVIVKDILWGLLKEIHLGQAMANGYAALLAQTGVPAIQQYQRLVKAAGETGPSLGRVVAVYAPLVVAAEDERLLLGFEAAVGKLHQRGLHAIPEPLDALTRLLKAQDLPTAIVYLKLIHQSLKVKLPFNQARHNCHHIAKALDICRPPKRRWQLKQLLRLTEIHPALIEPFLTGMKQGLALLSEENLSTFVTIALQQHQGASHRIKDYLSLTTFSAQQTLSDLKIAVSLSEVRSLLSHYLNARTGRRIAIEPMSVISNAFVLPDYKLPLVLSDGQSIFLPNRIETYATYEENRLLYLTLAKLESALFEFGTFDFDIERLFTQCPDMGSQPPPGLSKESDLDVFFNEFSCPALAADLFTIFEHGRLWFLMSRHYPGIVRQAKLLLLKEANDVHANASTDIRFALSIAMMLGKEAVPQIGVFSYEAGLEMLLDQCQALFNSDSSAETSAHVVFKTYSTISEIITEEDEDTLTSYLPFQPLFGRRIMPSLFHRAFGHLSPSVERIKKHMRSKGFVMLRADLRRELIQSSGRITKEGMLKIVKNAKRNGTSVPISDVLVDLAQTMPDLISQDVGEALAPEDQGLPVFWHSEWDHRLPDYRPRHVRVVERQLSDAPADNYHDILTRYLPLVTTIRRAFERLKPEVLTLLRYWVEGDEFDYRALLDVVIDKKAGRMPSDRLYIKRIKKERDVAVLLLVDLSGSTKNRVAGTDKSVLFVEKEAIVLFCEALDIIGDAFAIAGFSGHGRLGVDYYPVKSFEEPLSEQVQNKISNMTSQRSTRIGAAIRHAVSKLEKIPAKVRLLITLGDGYPNDLDYKGVYAVADTRKAIAEARFKGIHVRPITVNLDANETGDTLYDNLHHNIISDVRDLPNKLWRIYSDYTR